MPTKYTHLFSPVKIGSIEVRNRIAMMPMGVFTPRLINVKSGAYTKDGADYYIERAKGGTGLIITGVVPIIPLPMMNPVNYPEDYIAEMKYLANGIHRYNSKIFIQLTAMNGRAAQGSPAELELLPAPAPIQNVWDPTIYNRGITVAEIKAYIENFAKAALLAKKAGIDGVEVHALHEGYLLDQFAISSMNLRTDQYGGSLENRLRFPTEIVQAIKAKCGHDFPVSIRYSVKSYIKAFNRGALPGETFEEFGRDIEESRIIAHKLQEAGYDMLNCDNGSYDSWYWAHPPMYMPKACNLDDVAEIKKAVDIPVICAGRFDQPDVAEQAIADGRIDMMGMGRPLLADSELGNKFYTGKLSEVRPCISCHQGCLGRISQQLDISCAINPACGREKNYALTPAAVKKKVVIIGGGLGGLEAARVCALRGHIVDLYEKTDQLGGVFIAAAKPDFKEDDKHLLDWYIHQIESLNVTLHMNSEITKADLDTLAYDELFIATGAHERVLEVPGLTTQNTSYAANALLDDNIKGDNILIIGGGLTGCELAYMLAKDGKKVTLIEITETILNVYGLAAANYNMLMELMDLYQVSVIKNAVLKSYENGIATIIETIKNYPNIANRAKLMFAVGADGIPKEIKIPVDHIIISIGYQSNDSLYQEMKSPHTYVIGDAKKPANVMEAIWAAYEIAKDL